MPDPLLARKPDPLPTPSRAQCLELIAEMQMMVHIRDHSLQVCNVALALADHLLTTGINLDRAVVEAGALLHDITKTRSLVTGEDHALSGGQWLVKRGYPEVGAVVRQHVRLDRFDPAGPITETELVNYADKRVLHDQVVDLEQRMAYIHRRYGTTPEKQARIGRLVGQSRMLETKLFAPMALSPEALTGLKLENGNSILE